MPHLHFLHSTCNVINPLIQFCSLRNITVFDSIQLACFVTPFVRDWSFMTSQREAGVFRRVVYQNLNPPKNNYIWKLYPNLAITIFKSLLPALGIDFISYKMPWFSSAAWDFEGEEKSVHRRCPTPGGVPRRKFLNLGSRKCHLLHFLQDILSK